MMNFFAILFLIEFYMNYYYRLHCIANHWAQLLLEYKPNIYKFYWIFSWYFIKWAPGKANGAYEIALLESPILYMEFLWFR